LLGLDTELSWHLHEMLLRLARLGRVNGKSAGKLAERLSAPTHTNAAGHLLTHHQRSLLTQQFAAQLEMSGAWQAAAYVLLAFAPAPSCNLADANMSSTIEKERADADARKEAAQSLRALISRHPSPELNEAQEPEISFPHNEKQELQIRLTVDMIAERLQLRREEVKRWFLQSQAWAMRASFSFHAAAYSARTGGRSRDGPLRRLRTVKGLDEELQLCMRSEEWLHANHLVLTLITPSDLPDPGASTQGKGNEKLLQLLRKLNAGLSAFRHTQEWYRSASCAPPMPLSDRLLVVLLYVSVLSLPMLCARCAQTSRAMVWIRHGHRGDGGRERGRGGERE